MWTGPPGEHIQHSSNRLIFGDIGRRLGVAPPTLDTYGHLWPDADESTRTAVGAVIAQRMQSREITAD